MNKEQMKIEKAADVSEKLATLYHNGMANFVGDEKARKDFIRNLAKEGFRAGCEFTEQLCTVDKVYKLDGEKYVRVDAHTPDIVEACQSCALFTHEHCDDVMEKWGVICIGENGKAQFRFEKL